ncbi:MAG TPA: hypothetical protein VHY35_22385 [Stellaceae bacterium]|jgi:hypothetical protein|nr:hypothetical protein [Stellaceae bacterium]
MRVVTGLGILGDILLAAALITLSGYVFGRPEGTTAIEAGVLPWGFGLVASVVLPIIGLIVQANQRPRLGALIIWALPITVLVLVVY